MTAAQRKTAALIGALILTLLIVFAIPNARGARTLDMLKATSVDEPVTYAYVLRMLTPAIDYKDFFIRWVLYADYHYGYPFYLLSSLTVLPLQWLYGFGFGGNTGLALLVLRQVISVLPMLLAVGLMVYLVTRFRSAPASVVLFLFLISTRGITRNNIQWWHPDALSVLAVVLTIFFLERDRLRFGRDFYLAAVACGLAAGIKLAGFFFFLTIPFILAVGVAQKKISLGRSALAGLGFVLVMGVTLLASNPFLAFAGARNDLIDVQASKQLEINQGYAHDAPGLAEKSPQSWAWTLNTWYASPPFLIYLGISLLVGCIWGPNRRLNWLILTWIVPNAIYLLFFVAVKPDHYWLPVMLPLFATAINIPLALKEERIPRLAGRRGVRVGATALILVLLVGQMVVNVTRPYSGVAALYRGGLMVEVAPPH